MLVSLVLEIIINALLLHQAAHEGESGFPVLHTVIPFAIGAAQPVNDVAEPMILKDLVENLGDGVILKNPQPTSGSGTTARAHGRDTPSTCPENWSAQNG